MEWVVNATPQPLYLRERPGTHCIGRWMGPRTGLDGCGKSLLHRNSIRGPSSPCGVAIRTELPGPPTLVYSDAKYSVPLTTLQPISVETRTPTHRNLMDSGVTAPSPLLSPSSILPPTYFSCRTAG